MKNIYAALLRGINVGGNNKIPMKELRECFESAGFQDVTTYIQSGNVIFSSEITEIDGLTTTIEECIEQTFGINVPVVIIGHVQLRKIIEKAPKNWGKDPGMKHNLLFIRRPYSAAQALAETGEPKPEIETVSTGDAVVYWSASLKDFGRTASSRLASKPIYQQVTVRNYNTSVKLLELMNEKGRV